jgi:hypothetical protein
MPEDPLRTLTFTYTRADALAYERFARRMTISGVLALILWLAIGPIVLWVLPDNWAGTPSLPTFWALGAVFVAILYVLAMIRMTIGDLRRSRRRLRAPHDVTIDEYADRLGVTGTGLPRFVSFADAGRPVITPTHLFVAHGAAVVILPRRAFPEEGSFDGLVARLTAAAIAAAAVDPNPASA